MLRLIANCECLPGLLAASAASASSASSFTVLLLVLPLPTQVGAALCLCNAHSVFILTPHSTACVVAMELSTDACLSSQVFFHPSQRWVEIDDQRQVEQQQKRRRRPEREVHRDSLEAAEPQRGVIRQLQPHVLLVPQALKLLGRRGARLLLAVQVGKPLTRDHRPGIPQPTGGTSRRGPLLPPGDLPAYLVLIVFVDHHRHVRPPIRARMSPARRAAPGSCSREPSVKLARKATDVVVVVVIISVRHVRAYAAYMAHDIWLTRFVVVVSSSSDEAEQVLGELRGEATGLGRVTASRLSVFARMRGSSRRERDPKLHLAWGAYHMGYGSARGHSFFNDLPGYAYHMGYFIFWQVHVHVDLTNLDLRILTYPGTVLFCVMHAYSC